MKAWQLLLVLILSPIFQCATTASANAGLSLSGGAVLISLDGDSTLHKYQSKSNRAKIQGTLKAAPGKSLLEALKSGDLASLKIAIPVEEMKSGEKDLDTNMYKAMDSSAHPLILYSMRRYTVKDSTVLAFGNLEVNGVSRAVSLTGALADLSGTVTVKGSYDLLMSEFKVKAPVLMLGTIRCSDKLTINYDFQLKLGSEPSGINP